MKKILNISLLFGLLLVLSVSLVSAELTLNYPAASSTISGTSIFNVTVPESDSGGVDFNCSLYAKSSITGNSSWTILLTDIKNVTGYGGENYTNSTFDTTAIEDGNDYVFNVTCQNETKVFATNTSTAITVDNTVPTAASALSPTTDTDGDVTFSGTVTGSETTSCTLRFVGKNPGLSVYTMDHSGSTCTYSLTAVPEQTYEWFIRASDETNTTDSSSIRTNVDISTGGAKGAAAWLISQGKARPGRSATLAFVTDGTVGGIPIWLIVMVVIVLAVIYFVIKK